MNKKCVTCYNNDTTPFLGLKKIPNSKVGGFDFTVTGVNAKYRGMLSKAAQKKLEELRQEQKRKEKHEKYVKTLNQETMKLERELDFMKERDRDNEQGILQMDKFFSDGVPINNNILTMKSQYQQFRETGEKEIEVLELRKGEMLKDIDELVSDNNILKMQLMELEGEITEKKDGYKIKAEELQGKLFEEKKQKAMQQIDFDREYASFKEISDKNALLARGLQKNKLLEIQIKEQGANKLKSIEEILTQKSEMINKLETELEATSNRMALDLDKKQLERENMQLEERLLKSEKQINIMSARIKETELLLSAKESEREHEAAVRKGLTDEIDSFKHKIEETQRFGDIQIDHQVAEKENNIVRDLQRNIELTGKNLNTTYSKNTEKQKK